jgi:hypothetical protein
MGDPYAILGLDSTASATEIRAAYVRRLQQIAVTSDPGSDEEEAQVNLAYETLCDPEKRREYDLDSGPTAARPPSTEAGGDDLPGTCGCMICGRRPTKLFSFSGNQGFLVFRKMFHSDGWLCSSCATGTFRSVQTRNLSWGWFGLISFVATIAYGIQNMVNYYQGRKELTAPTPADRVLEKKLQGRPVLLGLLPRLGPILVVIGVLVWVGVTHAERDSADNAYLDGLPSINDARNNLWTLAEWRWEEYSAGSSAESLGSRYPIALELASLQEKVGAMTVPASDTLRVDHEAWQESMLQLASTEQALASNNTDDNIAACILAWQKEDAAYTPILAYYNSHRAR